MKKMSIMTGLMAGAVLLTPLAAFSQPSSQPRDTAMQKPFQKMFKELKLTPDQQTKLKAQHRQMKEEGKAIFEQMKGIRDKVRTELLKDKPSKATLDDYATQLAELHKQLIRKRHEHLLGAKAVLTPEQFSKLVNREYKGPGQMGKGLYKRMGKDSCKHGPGMGGEMDD